MVSSLRLVGPLRLILCARLMIRSNYGGPEGWLAEPIGASACGSTGLVIDGSAVATPVLQDFE